MTEGGVSGLIPPAIEIVQARCQSGPSELRSGVLDIIMRPEKGWLSSKSGKWRTTPTAQTETEK
jgi:hypothetical protein